VTVYGIFGDCNASPKLVRAALDDQYDTWCNYDDGDDPLFRLVVLHSAVPVYKVIIDWAEKVGVEVVPAASEKEVVDRCYALEGDIAKIYALLGAEDPSTEVARTICRAVDHGMEVRDLAEAGLTYIRPADNPLPPNKENITVAEEQLSLPEVGEIADDEEHEDNADAIKALVTYAKANGVDPDDHEDKSWSEFALFLDELPEPEPGEGGDEDRGGGHTEESLADVELAELRLLAKNAGFADHAKARRNTLIRAILDAQNGIEPEGGDGDSPRTTSAAAGSAADDDVPNILAAIAVVVGWIKSL
jgi:hypothetical protein